MTLKTNDDGGSRGGRSEMRTWIGLELCLDGRLLLLGVTVLPPLGVGGVADDGDVLLLEQVGSDPRSLRRNTATVRCTILLSLLACPGCCPPAAAGPEGWLDGCSLRAVSL